MKKLITGAFMLCATVFYSQQFLVTPHGLKSKSNPDHNYLVLKIENKTAKELYTNALKYINLNYKNPSGVVKAKIENEYLRFTTYAPAFIKVNNGGVKLKVSANYSIELKFKNNKVRFEITELELTADNGGRYVFFKGSVWKGYPIYNKKEKLRLPKTKLDLELYFNSQVLQILKQLQNQSTAEDDW